MKPPVIHDTLGEPLYLVHIGGETSYFSWAEIDLLLNCNTVPPSAIAEEFFQDEG